MPNLRVFSFFPDVLQSKLTSDAPLHLLYTVRKYVKEDLNMCCLIHYSNVSDLKCTKYVSLQTGVC